MSASGSGKVMRQIAQARASGDVAGLAALVPYAQTMGISLAVQQGFCVDRYRDRAAGTMARDASGRMAMTVVTLRPEVAFSGTPQPTRAQVEALHHRAHEECFIANSVKTEVRCEPVFAP